MWNNFSYNIVHRTFLQNFFYTRVNHLLSGTKAKCIKIIIDYYIIPNPTYEELNSRAIFHPFFLWKDQSTRTIGQCSTVVFNIILTE